MTTAESPSRRHARFSEALMSKLGLPQLKESRV
jgi:hypothetical protein